MSKVALVVPIVLFAVAPLIGRWRARVWLKRRQRLERERQAAASLTKPVSNEVVLQ